MDSGARPRFEALFRAHSRPLLAYALRRVEHPPDAADAVSETMLVAWRRLDDVPPEPGTRPWLFGVARRVLANQSRAERRRVRLGDRLRTELEVALGGQAAEPDADLEVVRAALAALSDGDRELLRLAAWEGLEPREIARVMGIPGPTARTRLHRARRRLRRKLEGMGWDRERIEAAGHVRGEGRTPINCAEEEA